MVHDHETAPAASALFGSRPCAVAPLEYVTVIVQREPAVVIPRAAAANPLRTGLVTLRDTECDGAAVLGAGVGGGLGDVTVGGRVVIGAAVGARVARPAVAGIADRSLLGCATGGEGEPPAPDTEADAGANDGDADSVTDVGVTTTLGRGPSAADKLKESASRGPSASTNTSSSAAAATSQPSHATQRGLTVDGLSP